MKKIILINSTGIYLIILVEFLEPVLPDLYYYLLPEPEYITIEGKKYYIIEKIINKEIKKVPNIRK